MVKGLIICVDDEKIVLDTLKSLLLKPFENYYLEFAESAEEALEVLEEYEDEEITTLAVVTDWLMPGMKGDEFLVKVHKKYPKSLKIILSGLIDESGLRKAKKEANLYKFFSKPWDANELIRSINNGLQSNFDCEEQLI